MDSNIEITYKTKNKEIINKNYTFPNDIIKDIIWKRVLDRCENKDGCLIWTGPAPDNSPFWEYIPISDIEKEYKSDKRLTFNIRKLAFQMYNNDIEITNKEKIISKCNNNLCIHKEHLIKTTLKSTIDFKKALDKLISKSIRLEKEENQEIGCLIWQGQKSKSGYGIVSIFGKKYQSHLLSVMIKDNITEIPNDNLGRRLIVRHMCKNKMCCEPSHLCLGDYDTNNLDDKIRDNTLLRGSDCKHTKTDEKLAQEIKDSWYPMNHPNYIPVSERAKKFNISAHLVNSIDQGGAWGHLSGKNDDLIKEKIKNRKDRQQEVRFEIREKGLSQEDYNLLKEKIYNKSIVSEDKFYNNIPCRLWTGLIHSDYGRLRYKYCCFFVHVIICEWKNKFKKPKGLVTRHLCGNKLCVESEHLEFGTPRDNMIDVLIHNNKNKLNYDIAEIIRNELNNNNSKENIEKLAEEYNIKISTVKGLRNNNNWIK